MPSSDGQKPVKRPRRRDAERNRVEILKAASEAFGELGLQASLEEIARRAGLGSATLYRHFPRREDLIDEIFADRLAATQATLERALAAADPWEGFATWFEALFALQVRDRGFGDVLTMRFPDAPKLTEVSRRVYPLAVEVIVRAQRAGVLRADFSPEDVPVLLWANARIIEVTESFSPSVWRRYLAFTLDGLRAESAHTSVGTAPMDPDDGRAAFLAMGELARRGPR